MTITWMLYLSTIGLMMGSPDLFIFWIFMELQTLLILMVMKEKEMKETQMFSKSMFYFMIQSALGMIFLVSVAQMTEQPNMNSNTIMTVVLLAKMGVFPFHMWLLELTLLLSPLLMCLMLTVQKIPLIIISVNNMSLSIIFGLILSAVAGSIMTLFSKNLNQMIVSSSIYSTLWIVLLASESMWLMMIFYILYGTIILEMALMKENKSSTTMMMCMMFFLGLPPTTMFYLKVFSIEMMMKTTSVSIMMIILSAVLISLMGYLKMFTKMTLENIKLMKKLKMWKKMPLAVMSSMAVISVLTTI